MDDVLDVPVDAAAAVAEVTEEAIDNATTAANQALHSAINTLGDALRVSGESHERGMASISDRLAAIESKLVTATEEAAVEASELVEDVVDAAAETPGAAVEEVEAVIESASEPPQRKKRGMLGAMSKKKGRR